MGEAFQLETISAGGFRALPVIEDGGIRLTLEGTAELHAAPVLETVIQQIHREALRLRVGEVIVDLRRLEFMSSSCFKIFVTWLGDLQDLPKGQAYLIRLLSDPDIHWQGRSLSALSCFAVALVRVES